MKFAFLVHPISEVTEAVLNMDDDGRIRAQWGGDLLGLFETLQSSFASGRNVPTRGSREVRVLDHLADLHSAADTRTEGRLYQIPMGAGEIIRQPDQALRYMKQAVSEAADWGAEIVGLGSMTGIVGGRGTFLAEHCNLPVTTGNSLTVYAALENLREACEEAELELGQQTLAVVGIPGSIASATAEILREQVRELLLVARHASRPAIALSEKIGAELICDIPAALRRAQVVISATSSGNCIRQEELNPGSIVVDIGVPADVQGAAAIRSDVLIISGGLTLAPATMSRRSMWMAFHHGVLPGCLAETVTLALEKRGEPFSLGRLLETDRILEIGELATKHGFGFRHLASFGLRLRPAAIAQFQKSLYRCRTQRRPKRSHSHATADHSLGNGCAGAEATRKSNRTAGRNSNEPRVSKVDSQDDRMTPPSPAQLADRAMHRYSRHVNPVLVAIGSKTGITKTFVRGQGNYLWDETEEKYLDFVAGFGAMNLGHNHPRVVAAVERALRAEAPGFAQSAVNPYAAALAQKLVAITPASLEMVFFANSGTEANEAALKLARRCTDRNGLLYCEGAFHGKSLGSLSVTGNPGYQASFRPLIPDCQSVTYGDLEALERALSSRTFAAFIVEPIQGEGGMVAPPRGYLREAQALCRASDTLLIVDEIQTGLGRTGEMFACDRGGIEPDVMTLAKSLGGGLVPIGAMLARRELWMKAYGSISKFALHTSTFGGGSLACAAALEAIRVLCEDGVLANARDRSAQLRRGLDRIVADTSGALAVRGKGLMLGLQIDLLPAIIAAHWRDTAESNMLPYLIDGLDQFVATAPSMYVTVGLLMQHHIYCQVTRSDPSVLRIQPPLTIEEHEVARFLESLRSMCEETDTCQHIAEEAISKSVSGHHDAGRDQEGRPQYRPIRNATDSESVASAAIAPPIRLPNCNPVLDDGVGSTLPS